MADPNITKKLRSYLAPEIKSGYYIEKEYDQILDMGEYQVNITYTIKNKEKIAEIKGTYKKIGGSPVPFTIHLERKKKKFFS